MSNYLISALMTACALTVANFLWAAVSTRDWSSAFERSFFQTMALIIFAAVMAPTTS